MKILNLYAGLGGNRKLWGNYHDIIAVEIEPDIARFYSDHYPGDTVVVDDAHQYLLEHYKEFDFIWASPPCPTHSKMRLLNVNKGINDYKYPDMSLYQEIILLESQFDGYYVVENVKPYYDYLIEPNVVIGRHPFWSNFLIPAINTKNGDIREVPGVNSVNKHQKRLGINIDGYTFKTPRQKTLKNAVDPQIGLHIFNHIPANVTAGTRQLTF